jgi:3-dehydroquinate synthase
VNTTARFRSHNARQRKRSVVCNTLYRFMIANVDRPMAHTLIPIDIPHAPTHLLVERGSTARLAEVLSAHGIVVADRRVLLVVDRNLTPLAARAAASLAAAQAHVGAVHLDATEDDKSLDVLAEIWSAALAHRLDRRDLVIAIGGGLIGDLAGFAAGTYMRGIDLVQVPTTLLAMVDAAIGGKTGINLTLPGGGLGKNLAGVFWQPKLTVADPDALATLPERELRAGLAECIKHAVIAGEPRFTALDIDAELLARGDSAALDRLIPSSAAVKAAIVSRDPFERGERAHLNLGHTFGHAIETLPDANLLHGEAVAIGMCAACTCALEHGMLAREEHDAIRALITRVGLPTQLPTQLPRVTAGQADDILRRMAFDKKNERGVLRLVLPRAIGRVEVVVGVPEATVRKALASIGAADSDGTSSGRPHRP